VIVTVTGVLAVSNGVTGKLTDDGEAEIGAEL
jgi:hypothetical protein